jgi:hypothetical protein
MDYRSGNVLDILSAYLDKAMATGLPFKEEGC